MQRRTALPLTYALALFLLSFPAPARAQQKDLDSKIDIDVVKAKDVFKLFAEAAGMELVLDPAVKNGPLSLRLENVRVRIALDAACDSLDCRWQVDPGNPPRLKVMPADRKPDPEDPKTAALNSKIDIAVTNAEGAQVLTSCAEILSAGASIDPGLKDKVTLDLKNVSVREILDAVCNLIGCTWSLKGESPVLEVLPRRK